MTDTPSKLTTNGRGLWFVVCRWCPAQTPARTERDDLRALADAKRLGWSIRPHPEEGWRVVCPACARRGAEC